MGMLIMWKNKKVTCVIWVKMENWTLVMRHVDWVKGACVMSDEACWIWFRMKKELVWWNMLNLKKVQESMEYEMIILWQNKREDFATGILILRRKKGKNVQWGMFNLRQNNSRHSDSGHWFPMLHLSRRVDMSYERARWGIGPNESDAISSHMDIHLRGKRIKVTSLKISVIYCIVGGGTVVWNMLISEKLKDWMRYTPELQLFTRGRLLTVPRGGHQ
jgi:hypothetical protein